MALALLGHQSTRDAPESSRQQDLRELRHKPLLYPLQHTVGGLWDQFTEKYVEQCLIMLILQTKCPFEKTGKKGIISWSFLDCGNEATGEGRGTLRSLRSPDVRAWDLRWLGTVTHASLGPSGGMTSWSENDLRVPVWGKNTRERVQA